MERQIRQTYHKSAKGIYEKWQKYMERAEQKLAPLQKAYDDAKKSGDKDLIRETGKALGIAQRNITIQNAAYKDMLDKTTRQLSKVNQTALNIVNGDMGDIYGLNYNADDIEDAITDAGMNFGVVDQATINRRIKDGDIRLPKKKIDIPKDMAWNTKQLNSSVLQGILQGESMRDIAQRILPIVNHNAASAIRNARTMVTSAENQGRIDRYHQLEDDGVVLKKVWIATADDRTRESHLELDGEERNIAEVFSNGLIRPADPNGEPEEVYNCRCALGTHVIGFKNSKGEVIPIDYEPDDTLHEQQIEEERAKREGGKKSQADR